MNPILFGLLVIVQLIFAIVLIVSCSILLNRINNNDQRAIGIVDYITENLRQPLIEEVEIQSGGQCSSGFQVLNIGEWKGTKKGCQTSFGKETTDCKDFTIPALPTQNFTIWNGVTLCYKPIADYTLSQVCSASYTHCPGDICIPTGKSCPYNGISFTNVTVSDPQIKQLKFADKAYLNLQRLQENKPPLIAIEFSENNKPCYSRPYYDVRPPKALDYELITQEYECGIYGLDKSAVHIHNYSKIELLNANNPQILTTLLGYEQTIKDDKVILSARPRIELKNEQICQEVPKEHKVRVDVDHLKSHKSKIFGLLFFDIVGLIVGLFYLTFLIWKGKFISESQKKFGVWTFITFTWFFIEFITACVTYGGLKSDTKEIRNVEFTMDNLYQNNCFVDYEYIRAIKNFERFIRFVPNSVNINANTVFAINFIRFLVLLLCVIIACKNRRSSGTNKVKQPNGSSLSDMPDNGNNKSVVETKQQFNMV